MKALRPIYIAAIFVLVFSCCQNTGSEQERTGDQQATDHNTNASTDYAYKKEVTYTLNANELCQDFLKNRQNVLEKYQRTWVEVNGRVQHFNFNEPNCNYVIIACQDSEHNPAPVHIKCCLKEVGRTRPDITKGQWIKISGVLREIENNEIIIDNASIEEGQTTNQTPDQ